MFSISRETRDQATRMTEFFGNTVKFDTTPAVPTAVDHVSRERHAHLLVLEAAALTAAYYEDIEARMTAFQQFYLGS